MVDRSAFAGGDQSYLRKEQYARSDRLGVRAALHERYSTAEQPWFDWVTDRIDLESGLQVLEVGCGAGWLWERADLAAPVGMSLELTDLSSGMVGEAVDRVVTARHFASVGGRVADAQQLPYRDGRFDRVVANHMLYHLPDPAVGAAELGRVVGPGGRVIVATNGPEHMQPLWTMRAEVFGTAPIDETVEVFGRETGRRVLEDLFEHVVWDSYEDQLRCTDPADVMAYLCSTPPAETAGDDQLAELRLRIDAAFASGDGTLVVSKDTGCFVCRSPRRR